MKFAKVLQSELVPEWKKAYIDYKGLKRLLASIKRSLKEQQSSQQSQQSQQSHQQSLHEQERCNSVNTNVSISSNHTEISIPIPQQSGNRISNSSSKPDSYLNRLKSFSKKRKTSLSSSRRQSPLISYDTLWEQVNPQEEKFFKALEENLDKVEKFYEEKLSETLNRFNELVEQYNFMKETRIKKKVS
ncbi:hypothetical protein RclHR1_01720004 [Rhizophagus clarus]|uniref:SPX domain-containing protein n=1 Tax=Rhizophagus clarus TaxID=94130 RepID=A0A2Z6QJL2_9GLOM|nr:hypothetical protein RclHR1_01720004 [Rhizophagus clarus]